MDQGWGNKTTPLRDASGMVLRTAAGKIRNERFAGSLQELRDIRDGWEDLVNVHLARAGVERTISMKSYASQRTGVTATEHLGPAVAALLRSDRTCAQKERHLAIQLSRASEIKDNPGLIIDLLTAQQSTFTNVEIDALIARFLSDPDEAAAVKAAIAADTRLAKLGASTVSGQETADPVVTHPAIYDDVTAPAMAVDAASKTTSQVYSTHAIIALEGTMATDAEILLSAHGTAITGRATAAAIAQIEMSDAGNPFKLDREQIDAVAHITGPERIAAVIGIAGAGKSTLLKAANIA